MHLPLNRIFYFSLFISVGVIASAIRSTHRRKRISRTFDVRNKLTATEFGSFYFTGETASVAAEVRLLLEKIVKMNLSGLQPGDTFSKELHFDEMNRDLFQKFIAAVEGKFDIDLPAVDSCMNMSVKEFVTAVQRKIESENNHTDP